jgi:hypothetical protein
VEFLTKGIDECVIAKMIFTVISKTKSDISSDDFKGICDAEMDLATSRNGSRSKKFGFVPTVGWSRGKNYVGCGSEKLYFR